VLWGIEYIVCMCIIIDTILILEMIVWVPRVYLVGEWAAIIPSMGRVEECVLCIDLNI
jgi:hypothetical protein